MAQTGLEDYVPRQHRAKMKKCLKEEWNNQCAYCGWTERNKELTVDHVVPIARQGSESYYNQVPACRSCNVSKSDKPVRQWYFDQESFTVERWNKIKDHMNKEIQDVLAS